MMENTFTKNLWNVIKFIIYCLNYYFSFYDYKNYKIITAVII